MSFAFLAVYLHMDVVDNLYNATQIKRHCLCLVLRNEQLQWH